MSYELHPLCTFFPRVTGEAFDSLVRDLAANGLRQPIVLLDGMILDGGNRYRACLDADVAPRFVELDEGEDPVAFVLSANLHRRHLSAGQQAAIVSSAQNWASAHPAHRARKTTTQEGCNLAPFPASTVAQRSAQSGASIRTQQLADKVAREDPALAVQVAHGETTLPKAVEKLTGKRPGAKPVQAALQKHEPDTEHGPDDAEMAAAEAAQAAMVNELYRLADADDKLAEAFKTIERLTALVESQRMRINGLTNENGELIREVKRLRNKLAKVPA